MVVKWLIFIMCLLFTGVSEAQVSQGTVFSKTEDGNGNKITSTVTGPSRGLDINCLAGCSGGPGGGGTSSSYGAAFPATGTAAGFSDGVNMRPGFAVDADTGAGTQYVQGINLVFRANGGSVEAGTVGNPFNVAGTFFQAIQPVSQSGVWSSGRTWTLSSGTDSVAAVQSGAWTVAATQSGAWSTGRTWTLSSGTDSVLAAQSGTWNIGTLTSITNPVAVTGTFFQVTQPVSGTVAVSNNFLLDATFTGRFAAAFASADGIAAQTSTFIHGGMMGWNASTAKWDRLRVDTSDNLNVNIAANSFGTFTITGAVTVASTTITGTVTVAGAKTNNNAVPGATNVGVLPCVANAAAPTQTEGNQVACSTLLNGGTRSDITTVAGLAPGVTNPLPVRDGNGTSFYSSTTIGANVYKKVATIQDIQVSASNSSTANLNAGITFTGTSNTTLGVGSIQVNLFADQNCTIQVQQAQEDPGVNWNIIDSWTYTANSTGNDAARTIQATGSSVRVLVTNNGAGATTVLRLQTIVCPICDTLPRGLTQKGQLKVSLEEQATIASANNTGACTSGAATFTALASNTSRTWAAVWASPANTDDVFIKLGATATNANARFSPGQALNLTSGKIYTGVIDVFPNSGTQAVCVMELN